MAVTRDSLKARAPDLANIGDAVLDACLAEAIREIASGNWDAADYDDAVTFLALHFAAKSKAGSLAGGPVSQMGVGPLTRSYAVSQSSANDGDLGSTSWGRRLLERMRGNLKIALPVMVF